jgi:XRE family transcriptional regulator, fatty acid utilization regulator
VQGRKILGQNIRRIRLEAGKSQQAIADILDVSVSRISEFESGRFATTIDVIENIADALGVPMAALLDETTTQKPKTERAPRKSEAERLPRPKANKRRGN